MLTKDQYSHKRLPQKLPSFWRIDNSNVQKKICYRNNLPSTLDKSDGNVGDSNSGQQDQESYFVLKEGSTVIGPLDSKIIDCEWDRVTLKFSETPLAIGNYVSLWTYTSNQEDSFSADSPLESVLWDSIGKIMGVEDDQNSSRDISEYPVHSRPGQFLWVQIKVHTSSETQNLKIEKVLAHYPRESYLNMLPAVFSSDEEMRTFLSNFLSVFKRSWDDLERKVEGFWEYLDPQGIPNEEFMDYLASWVALTFDASWKLEQKRKLLIAVPELYATRGTKKTLRQYLRIYIENSTGITQNKQRTFPILVEGFQERRRFQLNSNEHPFSRLPSDVSLWGPSEVQRLQLDVFSQEGNVRLISAGEPSLDVFNKFAHRFKVIIPKNWVSSQADDKDWNALEERASHTIKESVLRQVIEQEKPAEAAYELCMVRPGFQIGYQSTVGVDTILTSREVSRSRVNESSQCCP